MSSDDGDGDSREESSTDQEMRNMEMRIRVSLRLRPMNKLEASRRSKNCIEIHNDEEDDDPPTSLTVDSPLEGEFDFSFDRVFDENASQFEVFKDTVSLTASQLLDGYNSTVIAYGQTGSGKTHTMMGCGGGIGSAEKKRDGNQGNDRSEDLSSQASMDDMDLADSEDVEGLIPRTVRSLFGSMKESSQTVEYMVRCSYIEIHLEKIVDLLNQGGLGNVTLNIIDDALADEAAGVGGNTVGVRIVGAAEVCCVDESDVFGLLTRGNACRAASNTKMNTDSSRSHTAFVLKIEQRDTESGETKNSVLHMLDLAGSEMATKTQSQQINNQSSNAAQAETKMINKSLLTLNNIVRAQAKSQREGNTSSLASSRETKLTRLLRPGFGGNCITTIILTASASSYNIGETISTIRFGQFCKHIRNSPVLNIELGPKIYREQLIKHEKEKNALQYLAKELATECQFLKTESEAGPINADYHTGPLWDTIEELVKDDEIKDQAQYDNNEGNDGCKNTVVGKEHLQKELNQAGNALAELHSEVAMLRTHNDKLSTDSKKNMQDLIDMKNENQMLAQRKMAVEHNLRTSQFRENEATTFLRQFRKFYQRLLRTKAAQGSGSTPEITHKTPGVPQLNDLIDVDTLLLESGIIEEDELRGEEASGAYRPSKGALLRSTSAAKRASNNAVGSVLTSSAFSSEVSGEDGSSYATDSSVNTSVKRMGALDITSGNEALDAISEIGDGGVSQYARSSLNDEMANSQHFNGGNADDLSGIGRRKSVEDYDDEIKTVEGRSGGGADAGAGAAPGPSTLSDEKKSPSTCIRVAKGTYAGAFIADCQKKLHTPAGRLIASQEKELETTLKNLTQQCVKLQIDLDEEKANMEALVNRSGSATLSKKRLAQEAIQLRQQLDRKTHDLQAIIWKMNELHLINKTYTDKMASREQHVSYLEEHLDDLQNTYRRVLKERQMAETKLREELDTLKDLVDGMTIPLWQFGERGQQVRALATRIVSPVAVTEYIVDSMEEQASLSSSSNTKSSNFGGVAIEPAVADAVSDIGEGSASVVADEGFVVGGQLVHATTQTDEKPRVERIEIGLQTDLESLSEKEEKGAQTSAVQVLTTETQTGERPSVDMSTMAGVEFKKELESPEIVSPTGQSCVTSSARNNAIPVAIGTSVLLGMDDPQRNSTDNSAHGDAVVGEKIGGNTSSMEAVPRDNNDSKLSRDDVSSGSDSDSESKVVVNDTDLNQDMAAMSKKSNQTNSENNDEFSDKKSTNVAAASAVALAEPFANHHQSEDELKQESSLPGINGASGEDDAILYAAKGVSTDSVLESSEDEEPDGDGRYVDQASSNSPVNANHRDDINKSSYGKDSEESAVGIETSDPEGPDPISNARALLFVGGRDNDFVPRRFTKKLGLTIRPAILQKEKKPKEQRDKSKKKKSRKDESKKKTSKTSKSTKPRSGGSEQNSLKESVARSSPEKQP